MKKALGIIIVFLAFYSSIFSLDPCFPGGIVFSTQHDIDIYKEIYPDCTEILAGVVIEGDDIVDLEGISSITIIHGDLIIRNCPNLTSTHGLLNLNYVGGSFKFINNDTKVNLNGLSGLTYIGSDILIQDNDLLATLTGGTVLQFFFPGLQNVTSIGGGIFIESNAVLEDLEGLVDLVSINGDITISNNIVLENIEGLAGISENVHDLNILENIALVDLMGLHNISSISGVLRLENNDLLVDCNGLDGMNSVGDLIVNFNDALVSLEGLSNLEYNTGVLSVQGNESIQNLNGLNNLTEVGSIIFFNNPNLEEITDLHDITSIAGGIYIEQNNALNSLQGIDNISIDGMYEVYIFRNAQLSVCDVESICNYLDSGEPVFIDDNASGCATEEEVDEACSPPYCPQIISPMDDEEDVDLFTTISWPDDDNANGFFISIGTSPYGTDLVNHEDLGYTTSYQYEGGFSCHSTIHVRITGYNDNGESLDCSEIVFTTESASVAIVSGVEVCKGDSVQLEAFSDASSISWSPAESLDDPYSFTPFAAPESTTTYTATVYSSHYNCIATSFTTVLVHEGITAINTGLSPLILCANDCSYQLMSTPAGGQAPFEYLWSTGDDTFIIDELCAGTYGLTVTDANGCTEEMETTIYELPRLLLELNEIIHVTDTTMGSISMYEFIWTSPFTQNVEDPVEWTGVDFEFYSTDTNIENLSAGCYRLTTFGGEESCSIDTVYCVEDNTTGIYEAKDFASNLNIYPNPTSSSLVFDPSGEMNIEYSIALLDASGRELHSFKMKGEKMILDASAYRPGLYYIKLSDEKMCQYRKVIFIE